jgi:hypothetical protein
MTCIDEVSLINACLALFGPALIDGLRLSQVSSEPNAEPVTLKPGDHEDSCC